MKITNEIFESFLNCKYKAHLKATAKIGTLTNFENFSKRLLAENMDVYYKKLSSKYSTKRFWGLSVLSLDTLGVGYDYLFNIIIETDILVTKITALEKIPQASSLGNFSYIPISLTPKHKIQKNNKLILAYHSLLVAVLQNKQPQIGKNIAASSLKTTRVRLPNLIKETNQIIAEIHKTLNKEKPPPTRLNNHCERCEFKKFCYHKAKAEDDLSLLKGLKEKEIVKLNSKGIFTVKQLSYTFRPRRQIKKRRRKAKTHLHSLKALAIRENKVFIYEKREIPNDKTRIYLDVEGDPDRNLYYLIGLVVDKGKSIQRYSFWVDDSKETVKTIRAFLNTLRKFKNIKVYHYGSYEKNFFRYVSKLTNEKNTVTVKRMVENSVNILSIIYPAIYFPTHGNGLKEIAKYLGFNWTSKNASGKQSVLWRLQWEKTNDQRIKDKLCTYNMEDCLALRQLTEFLFAIMEEKQTSKDIFSKAKVTSSFEQQISERYANRRFGKTKFLLDNFNHINKCAYFDYQRNKILIKSDKSFRKPSKNTTKSKKTRYPINREINVIKSRVCPWCKSKEIQIVGGNKRFSKVVIDLKFFKGGVKRWLTRYKTDYQRCLSCEKRFYPVKYRKLRRKYGHNLISWVVYQHIVNKVSFRKISKTISDNFTLSIDGNSLHQFKRYAAQFYEKAYKRMISQIKNWNIIHADESNVRVLGEKSYVWVFTNMKDVIFLYTETRKAKFISKLIKEFDGIFVSDFYVGYDSLKCEQQKCLIHLIRDINAALFKHQQNEELMYIANHFSVLLKKIVDTIEKFGLKKRNLNKHKKDVDKFYKNIKKVEYEYEIALKFIRRFEKYHEKLFTFLNYDGVPWNNANAEHAFKHFATFRRNVNGIFTERGIREYLILLSLYESCKYRNINFQNFLLSKEKYISTYLEKYTPLGNKRRRVAIRNVKNG
jgi:predicted RecB family nuclease